MNKIDNEILMITQEECAEITQVISKIFRFGLESEWQGESNIQRLTAEVGDLMCMVQLMYDRGFLDPSKVSLAAYAKEQKLKKWSNIYAEKEAT